MTEFLPRNCTCNEDSVGETPTQYCVHPKDSLFAFKIIRHSMTIVSIFITSLSTYVMISSRSVSRAYSGMLALLLLVWMSVDVIIQWVGDPIFLLPLMCMYRREPLINIPITAGACFGIVQSIIMFGLVNYIALFLYRHQLIVPPHSRLKISATAQIAFIVVLLVPSLALGFHFKKHSVTAENENGHWKFLAEQFYEAEIVPRIDCFPLGKWFYVHLTVVGAFAWMFIVMIAWHTLRLIEAANHISMTAKVMHRILNRSLIAQALTPVIFFFLPVLFATLANERLINQYPTFLIDSTVAPFDMVIVVISFHASSHSVVLLATTPAFRAKLAKMFPLFSNRTVPALASNTITGDNTTRTVILPVHSVQIDIH